MGTNNLFDVFLNYIAIHMSGKAVNFEEDTMGAILSKCGVMPDLPGE